MTDTAEMMQFEVVRNVTLPFLVMEADGTPYYIKFNTAIEPDKTSFSSRVRKNRKQNEDGKPQSEEPLHIAEVTNLQSGEVNRLILHFVLESNLNEAYPNNGYVDKYFKITKSKGRGFFNFNIVEIKLKGQDAGAKSGAKK